MFPKMNDPRFKLKAELFDHDLIIFQENYLGLPVNLDISHRCPLQCGGCFRQSSWYAKNKHLYKDMPKEDIKKFIDSGFKFLEFCGQQSDPLAHPDILDIISLCSGIRLIIHTATSHRKKEFYEEAFDRSGLMTSWVFGLDGLPEESHIHRINQNGVHLYEMMKLGVEMGISVKWQYIVFNYNQDHIDQARQMAEDNGIEFALSLSGRFDKQNKISHLKPRDEYCA